MANTVGAEVLVVVSLIDFHENNSIMMKNYFHQLTKHLRYYPNPIPFSMKFEEIHQIVGPEDHPFKSALDTKISYNHNCICVADEALERIVFFNLKTREFIKSFKFGENLACLLIEENFDGQNNDAIYFGECGSWRSTLGCTVKYRIKDLLGENPKPIWRNTELHDYGMDIRVNKNNQKQLFRFNSHKKIMNIMDTIDGYIIGSIQLDNVSYVSDLIFITPTKMIISDRLENKCYIFEEVNGDKTSTNEWKLIKKIEYVNNVKIHLPFGMTIDRVGKRIFISDYPRRLIVIDYDGKVIHTYESSSTESRQCGLCFDERTGLLYVTDDQSKCITVFK